MKCILLSEGAKGGFVFDISEIKNIPTSYEAKLRVELVIFGPIEQFPFVRQMRKRLRELAAGKNWTPK